MSEVPLYSCMGAHTLNLEAVGRWCVHTSTLSFSAPGHSLVPDTSTLTRARGLPALTDLIWDRVRQARRPRKGEKRKGLGLRI